MSDSFTCPVCRMTSHNAADAQERYCGDCDDYTGYCAAGSKLQSMRRGWTLPCLTLATHAMDISEDAGAVRTVPLCTPHFGELGRLLNGRAGWYGAGQAGG